MPFLKYKNVSIIDHSFLPVYQHYNFYQPHTLNKLALSLLKRDTKSEDQVKLKRDEVSIKAGLFLILFTLNVLNDKHFNVFKKLAKEMIKCSYNKIQELQDSMNSRMLVVLL